MQIGFNLPVSGPMATPETMARVARLGEELGFDYLTMTDHVALPDTSTPGYPYSETGAFYSPEPGHRFEQLTAVAWVAAKTEKIRLVLAVMVVPHRPAVITSKMLTTIDVLSGGRLVVGIGAGYQIFGASGVLGYKFFLCHPEGRHAVYLWPSFRFSDPQPVIIIRHHQRIYLHLRPVDERVA